MKKIKLYENEEPRTKCKSNTNHSECFYMRRAILHARMVVFIYFIFLGIDTVGSLRRGNLLIPQTYSPLNGDLNVQLQYFSQAKRKLNSNFHDVDLGSSDFDADDYMKTTSAPKTHSSNENDDIRLQVSRFIGTNRTTATIVDVYPDPRLNITQITISCLNFLYGGTYELEIVGGNDIEENVNTFDNHDERLRQQLDVRWPQPKLSVTPESIGTYPEQAVDVILEFPGVECTAPSHTQIDNMPEFWLELFFCGHDVFCDSTNISSSQVLYAEEVRGYPKAHMIKLSCELFGLAGHYVVKLRPVAPVSPTVTATAYIKADWSEQFVFNVHARSISPCDPHTGIGVLFEYPACILDRADRIRLFGKLRADVASLAPPTTLHYITEQRVVRGQHALHFDCDFFSEKFVEYCFVYVSQAISGAVADVRMDCLPTLPVRESERGGWSKWSDWTPCSTTCAGGTRNRYRVCDSPPPRYGAMFCEGKAVETEECGGSISDSWDCIYGAAGSDLPSEFVERPEIKADVGSDCRCGCIVHLTVTKPRRIIAASAQSCPGRTFWLIQSDPDHRIRLNFDFFRLICSDQYVRVRDGDSLASELVGEFIGGVSRNTEPIISSDSKLLVEFYSNELSLVGESCKGGFLTHAQQIQAVPKNVTAPRTSKAIMPKMIIIPPHTRLKMVHVIAILFSGLIIVLSALLLAQYVCRYRKYQLAGSAPEDSPAHTPRTSMGSIAAGQLPSRAVSTSTLFSEVVSFVKIRPRGRWMKHSRLRESVDGEALENALQTKRTLSDDTASLESTHTLTNETFNESNDACETSDVQMAPKRKKNLKKDNDSTNCGNSNEASSEHLSTSPSTSYGCHSTGSDDIDIKENDDDDAKIENVCYKHQELTKTGDSISLPRTPTDTPMPVRRNTITKKRMSEANRNSLSVDKEKQKDTAKPTATVKATAQIEAGYADNSNKSGGNDDLPTDAKSVNGKTSSKKKRNRLNIVGASNERITISTSHRSDAMRRLSVSNATLRNSCYSPASSIISVSTNRSVNIKESKEKKNREKLLAGPGSEFSLANPEDMEMDYYDYNVINAGAAPGSYLGMDPAYLIYIPPLDDDGSVHIEDHHFNGSDESDASGSTNNETEPHYEEISPIYETPGQNSLNGDHIDSQSDHSCIDESSQNRRYMVNTFNSSGSEKIRNKVTTSSSSSSLPKRPPLSDSIQMTEFKNSNKILRYPDTTHKVHQVTSHSYSEQRCSYGSDDKDRDTEKETAVVKSPSDNFNEYYELDDIQFADEDDEEIVEAFNGNRNDVGSIKMREHNKNRTIFGMH